MGLASSRARSRSPPSSFPHRHRAGTTPVRWAFRRPGPNRPRSVGEIDHDRCVVARLLTLAGVAVDDRPLRPRRHRTAPEHEIDAHAPPLVEVAGPVVPPRKDAAGVRVLPAEEVLETPVAQRLERGAL